MLIPKRVRIVSVGTVKVAFGTRWDPSRIERVLEGLSHSCDVRTGRYPKINDWPEGSIEQDLVLVNMGVYIPDLDNWNDLFKPKDDCSGYEPVLLPQLVAVRPLLKSHRFRRIRSIVVTGPLTCCEGELGQEMFQSICLDGGPEIVERNRRAGSYSDTWALFARQAAA